MRIWEEGLCLIAGRLWVHLNSLGEPVLVQEFQFSTLRPEMFHRPSYEARRFNLELLSAVSSKPLSHCPSSKGIATTEEKV